MTEPDTISADYTLRPSELASTLALLVEARQPTMVWGPPGCAKSQIAQQVAADLGREYIDIRALLLDPVDLRGIPWRDSAGRTQWAPPAFLPPHDDPGRWLICCPARGLRADRRDKLLKLLDTGGQNCTPNNTPRCAWRARPRPPG